MFRKVSFYPPDLRPLSSFHWPNDRQSVDRFSPNCVVTKAGCRREREREKRKEEKEGIWRPFGASGAGNPWRNVLESERERRSNDWIWPKLTRWKIGSNQRFTKKKKRKSREGCKIFSRRKEEYSEGIIFGKISHAIILSKEKSLFGRGIRLSTRAVQSWTSGGHDKNLVDFLCHPPSSKVVLLRVRHSYLTD